MTDNRNIEFQPNDFELVQSTAKIFDTKLDTKPTTFFRDALRRFAKNKSSVAAAIILAILVALSLLVPLLSPYNIDQVRTGEKFLEPKLFEAGTGFWDGTRSKTHIVYDADNQVPAVSEKYSVDALKRALVSLTVNPEPELVDMANPYGTGGVVVVATDARVVGNDVYLSSKKLAFNSKDEYRIDVVFSDEENVAESKLGEYRVYLKYGEGENDIVMIRDFSRDYSELSVNLSELLKKAGKDSANAQIVFDVKASAEALQYVLVESCVLSAKDSAPNLEQLAEVSFSDATEMVNNADKNSVGYWSCSGRKGIHNSEIYYCDYVLDTYMLVYGDADLVNYSATELQSWIDKGWCVYDYKVGPESFERLADECPVDEVVSQEIMGVTKKLSSITARGWNYRKMGYDKMPKFLFGTDAYGADQLTRAFSGLLTSLILGVCVTAVCLAIGIVWGAISGYYGGTADLLMERFKDILGSIPWLVVMTLFILHLGNTLGVFFLAMVAVDWMGPSSTTRMQFYRFKGREYVLASHTLGAKDSRLIFKHILPNGLGTIITRSVLMVAGVIRTEASLAYLNLGLQGSHSFGVMLAENQQYLGVYPFLVVFPAVIMALIMISLNLFGNGLRDAFNPALKGSE